MKILTPFAFATLGICFVFSSEWIRSENTTLNTASIVLMVIGTISFIVGEIALNTLLSRARKEGYQEGVDSTKHFYDSYNKQKNKYL